MTRPTDSELRRFLEPGSSFGSGDGDGSGAGNGPGDGYVVGSGDGNGYGVGSSSGGGYGSSSYGYGSGDGIWEYCGVPVRMVDGVTTLIYSVHRNYAKGAILGTDLMLEPCYIARVGNCFAHGDTIREARCDAVEKDLKKLPVKERIASFVAAHPDPDAECSGRDLYDWHHILTGSCRMGRDEWCREHGLSPARARMTVWEFCRLTADAYGGATIRAVAALYGISIEDNGEQDDRD